MLEWLEGALVALLIMALWYLGLLQRSAASNADRPAMHEGFRRLSIAAGAFTAIAFVVMILVLALGGRG